MPTSTDVFAQAEQEVYHAVSEWPLWLVLRLRRLEHTIENSNPKEKNHDLPAPDAD